MAKNGIRRYSNVPLIGGFRSSVNTLSNAIHYASTGGLHNGGSATTSFESEEAPPSGLLFHDPLTSGDFSHTENGVSWYSETTHCSVISGFGPNGLNNCIEFDYTETDGVWSEKRFTLSDGPYPELYIQWMAYYPDGTESPSRGTKWRTVEGDTGNNKVIRLFGGVNYTELHPRVGAETFDITGGISGDELLKLEASRAGEDTGLGPNYSEDWLTGASGINPFMNDARRGRWLKFKFHVRKSTTTSSADGLLEFYIDDELEAVWSNINHAQETAGFSAGYLMGSFNNYVSATTKMYIGDIKMSVEDIVDPVGVELTGSGFGLKTTPAPYFVQRFIDLEQDATPTEAGYVDNGNTAGTGPAFIDLNDGVAGGGCLLCRTDIGDWDNDNDRYNFENFWHIANDMPAGTIRIYRGTYVKVDRISGTTSSAMQLKAYRMGMTDPSDNVPYYSGPSTFKASIYLNSPSGEWNILNRSEINQAGSTVHDGSMDTASPPPPTLFPPWLAEGWNFVEEECQLNDISPTVANAFRRFRVNGATVCDESGYVMRTTSAATLEFCSLVPGMDAAIDTVWEVKFSNDYLDNDLARVIATDSADYEDSTIFRLQVCSAWSDTSITIPEPVWAGFGSGTTVYFHVFNAAGISVAVISRVAP